MVLAPIARRRLVVLRIPRHLDVRHSISFTRNRLPHICCTDTRPAAILLLQKPQYTTFQAIKYSGLCDALRFYIGWLGKNRKSKLRRGYMRFPCSVGAREGEFFLRGTLIAYGSSSRELSERKSVLPLCGCAKRTCL